MAEVLEHHRVIESYLGTDESAIQRSGTRSVKTWPEPARKTGDGPRRRTRLVAKR